MNKHPIKSKTMRSLAVAAIIVLMGILGVGEEQIGETYDTLTKTNGRQTETAKDIMVLAALGGAAYGRTMVGKGKDENKK